MVPKVGPQLASISRELGEYERIIDGRLGCGKVSVSRCVGCTNSGVSRILARQREARGGLLATDLSRALCRRFATDRPSVDFFHGYHAQCLSNLHAMSESHLKSQVSLVMDRERSVLS